MKRKSMRDDVFRELSDGAKAATACAETGLGAARRTCIFKAVSRPGRTSAVIGIKRMRKHEAEWYRVRSKKWKNILRL